jgi:hypothetical protein
MNQWIQRYCLIFSGTNPDLRSLGSCFAHCWSYGERLERQYCFRLAFRSGSMEDFSYKQHLVRSLKLIMSHINTDFWWILSPLHSHYDFMCTPRRSISPFLANPGKDIEDQVKVGERSSHHRVRAAWASIIPCRSRHNQHMKPQCVRSVEHKSLRKGCSNLISTYFNTFKGLAHYCNG